MIDLRGRAVVKFNKNTIEKGREKDKTKATTDTEEKRNNKKKCMK